MNRYKEALDELCDYAMECETDYDYDDNLIVDYVHLNEDDLKRLKEPLQELVEKATPKKVNAVKTKSYDTYEIKIYGYCPVCDSDVFFDYCPHCGQALDWGEEDVD